MQRIEIEHDFTKPPERVFAYLAEHEHLEPLFGAKIKRLQDGDTSRNGVGSVRQLRIAVLPPFEETTTEVVENELIWYRITKGSPLKGHHGEMHFSPQGTGTHFRYVIEFGAVVPGLDKVIAFGLERGIRKNLPAVDLKA